MGYKLIRVESKSSVEWYDTNTELSEEDVTQIEELYAGDVGAFLDNSQRVDYEEQAWEGELLREKDTGNTVEWIIEESV